MTNLWSADIRIGRLIFQAGCRKRRLNLALVFTKAASQYYVRRWGLIEMPFGLWAWMGRRNHVLEKDPDPPWEGAILWDRDAHCKVWGLSAVSCAKMVHHLFCLFCVVVHFLIGDACFCLC